MNLDRKTTDYVVEQSSQTFERIAFVAQDEGPQQALALAAGHIVQELMLIRYMLENVANSLDNMDDAGVSLGRGQPEVEP